MEEIFDIYTREGIHLGIKEKSICHSKNPGFYHKPVWIWIVNSKNEVLVQKRASVKKSFPNYWDMPSAGHVAAGESSIEGAIRETEEELGLKTKKEDYIYNKNYSNSPCCLLPTTAYTAGCSHGLVRGVACTAKCYACNRLHCIGVCYIQETDV